MSSRLDINLETRYRMHRVIRVLETMKIKRFWMLVIVLSVGVLSETDQGCSEQDRVALLQLKSFFNSPFSLRDWLGSDCCRWEGVMCSNTSRRLIVQLDLDNTRQLQGDGYLNISLFLPLKDLKSLYLVGNGIAGFVHTQGALKKLQVLDLTDNQLNDSISPWLSELSSLKSLYLTGNRFTGSNHRDGFKWLSRLRKLETLDLTSNYLNNSFLLHVGGFSSLTTLNLGFNQLEGSLNIKELSILRKLKSLDLSWNSIERFEGRNLMNLEELDLSGNHLQNSSFAFISGLSNLKSLTIQHNNMQGSIDIKELNKLAKLEEMDLSYNPIESLGSIYELGSLQKLTSLDLDEVFSDGTVSLLQVIQAFPSVKTFSLRNNYLNKTIFPQELNNVSSNVEEISIYGSYLSNNILQSIGVLTSLKRLILSNTGLTGPLPNKGWCDLRNLEGLDLSENEFEGSIPSCFSNLSSLQFMDISNNGIEVASSFDSFANNSQLKFLFVDQNKLASEPAFQTRTSNPNLQLKLLSMSNCKTNGLTQEPPNFLYYQHDLKYIDLSYNNFGGHNPSWLLENNTRLQQFLVAGSYSKGPLKLPRQANVDMFEVDMSGNEMQGQIPTNICSTFPNLQLVFLSKNSFEGNIPPCLGSLKSLSWLDLSYNNFSGGILEDLAKSGSLETLILSSNNLSGKIPAAIFTPPTLNQLYLDGNNFDGEIPLIHISADNHPGLTDIDLSNNSFTGKLPRWIWNVSSLQTLVLSDNYFNGLIPLELCNLDSLGYVDLSRNNFSGFVPSCISSLALGHLHLSRNRLNGPLPHALYNSSSLVTLDLSQNNFTGKIPFWIGTVSALSVLVLRANHFEGEIPSQICQLTSLSILDLSQNKLFGPIPSCLSNLSLESKYSKSITSASSAFAIQVLENTRFENIDRGHFYPRSFVQEQVMFTTKKGSYTYSGNILEYMSGIDFSCNMLSGQIPPEIGRLSELLSLNLSNNNFTGFIPSTFSMLRQIESLDLSYNKLSSTIPIQLMELSSLEVFNVSYNNLSGSIPHDKAQFATFDESSYLGNPFLCGPPKHASCTETSSTPTSPNAADNEEKSGFLDIHVFYVTFAVCYTIVLVTMGVVLYINPYWQRVWFYFIEQCINICHYFILDNIIGLFMFRRKS